jgi:N-sulfoglucosamine sulfohydrolase
MKKWMIRLLLLAGIQSAIGDQKSAVNVVVFSVDDMDITSVNCYGNPLPGLTPHMDQLASQGMRFLHAHVSSPICMPCRQSMMTGLHSHRNGSFGFVEVEKGACPSLSGLLMDAGYYTASIGKGRDYKAFPWDYCKDGLGADGWYSRKPESFYQEAQKAIRAAQKAGKPFYLGVNTSDPHRPWPGSGQEKEAVEKLRRKFPTVPGYPVMPPVCSEADVPLLPYLPDLPDIRTETVQYLTAVHRADDALGRILQLLDEEGLSENTLFVFFSDHDAAMPTAKQNTYRHSSEVPLMIRWPGTVKAGSVDRDHMVSTLDLMPTVLEAAGVPVPEKQDGRSMLPILKGGKQAGRDFVMTTYNYIEPGVQVFPMRAIHTKEWSYVFNPWSDGVITRERSGNQPTENQGGLTFAAMQEAAKTDPDMRKRVDYILLRRRDELFDLRRDPFSFDNLADSPEYSGQLELMKKTMAGEMARTEDPLLEGLLNGGDYPAVWDQKR